MEHHLSVNEIPSPHQEHIAVTEKLCQELELLYFYVVATHVFCQMVDLQAHQNPFSVTSVENDSDSISKNSLNHICNNLLLGFQTHHIHSVLVAS